MPKHPRLTAVRVWAHRIKRDGLTLWFACRDPRTPWWLKAMAFAVVAYALSPIDLVPDFIPVLGYLDDVILLPALIWLIVRCLPEDVLQDSRQQAEAWMTQQARKPVSRAGAVVVVLIWGALAVWFWRSDAVV